MVDDASGSVFDQFSRSAARFGDRAFINVLEETASIYGIEPGEITYRSMAHDADALIRQFAERGYGYGHRVGLLLENRPGFFLNWFALNALGVSVVPINPDLRSDDLLYLLNHSEQILTIATPQRIVQLSAVAARCDRSFPVISPGDPIPLAIAPVHSNPPDDMASAEAALLYTSGTTGLPKGCVLSNVYFLNCGRWYDSVGGHCALSGDGDRMITPLPLFHMNAMACSTMGMIAVGGCLTVLDRFHPRTWWDSVRASKATIVHYLGVMPSMLMGADAAPSDRDHNVQFGFGAGVDRTLHAVFEERFGFPLVEAWAMTETGNGAVVAASSDPRHVGTSCFGKPAPEVECRIDAGDDSEAGQGELLVRRAGANPRYGFFDRYLKDDAATEDAWRDGWFHTGDIVRRNPDGTLVFVDRKKNVIRRSGENIAAVEVEAALLRNDLVQSIAVCATPDSVRGDEVFACIVPSQDVVGREQEYARSIVEWCLERLAYYKAPGYVAFVKDLPLTATNKVQRGEMKVMVADLIAAEVYIDTRSLKKRSDAA